MLLPEKPEPFCLFLDELPAAEIQRDGADPVADAVHKKERAQAGLAAIQALFD